MAVASLLRIVLLLELVRRETEYAASCHVAVARPHGSCDLRGRLLQVASAAGVLAPAPIGVEERNSRIWDDWKSYADPSVDSKARIIYGSPPPGTKLPKIAPLKVEKSIQTPIENCIFALWSSSTH